jgi:hypothetical protein
MSFSRETNIISLNIIDQLVSVMETNSVFCEVGTELVLLKRASVSEGRADKVYKPCEKVMLLLHSE